jgi:hypothetical protein
MSVRPPTSHGATWCTSQRAGPASHPGQRHPPVAGKDRTPLGLGEHLTLRPWSRIRPPTVRSRSSTPPLEIIDTSASETGLPSRVRAASWVPWKASRNKPRSTAPRWRRSARRASSWSAVMTSLPRKAARWSTCTSATTTRACDSGTGGGHRATRTHPPRTHAGSHTRPRRPRPLPPARRSDAGPRRWCCQWPRSRRSRWRGGQPGTQAIIGFSAIRTATHRDCDLAVQSIDGPHRVEVQLVTSRRRRAMAVTTSAITA